MGPRQCPHAKSCLIHLVQGLKSLKHLTLHSRPPPLYKARCPTISSSLNATSAPLPSRCFMDCGTEDRLRMLASYSLARVCTWLVKYASEASLPRANTQGMSHFPCFALLSFPDVCIGPKQCPHVASCSGNLVNGLTNPILVEVAVILVDFNCIY